MGIKIMGVLPHRAEVLCTVLMHPEHFCDWFKACTYSQPVGRPSPFREIVYAHMYTLSKLAGGLIDQRDAIVLAYADSPSQGSAVAAMVSIEPNDPRLVTYQMELRRAQQGKRSFNGKTVPASINGIIQIDQLADGHSRVQLFAEFDFNLENLFKRGPFALAAAMPILGNAYKAAAQEFTDGFTRMFAIGNPPLSHGFLGDIHRQACKLEPGGELQHITSESAAGSTYRDLCKRLSAP